MILISLILCIILYYTVKLWPMFRKLRRLPHGPRSWIYGDVKDLLPSPFGNCREPLGVAARKFMEERNEKYWYKHKVFSFWVFWYPFVNITDPDMIETVLKDHLDKPAAYFLLRQAMKEGLLTSNGNKWKVRRRQVRPSLAKKPCEDFMVNFNDVTLKWLHVLYDLDGKQTSVDELYVDPVLEIVFQTIFGIDYTQADIDKIKKYLFLAQDNADQILACYLNPIKWIPAVFNILEKNRVAKLTKGYWETIDWIASQSLKKWGKTESNGGKVIESDSNSDETTGSDKPYEAYAEILVKLYLKSESKGDKSFTRENLIEELATAFIGGFETTVRALTWTTYLLACHPEIQEKARAEVDRLFVNDKNEVETEDLKDLVLVEGSIREAMRLFPALTFLSRRASHDFEIGGYEIPKGVSVVIPVWSIQRCPEYYPNPNSFIPERYTTEGQAGRSPYLYLPFSGGPRGCIGQLYSWFEMKTIMAHILRNFIIHTPLSYKEFEYCFNFQQKATGPLMVSFEKREH
ncbi:cytochrome P450 4c21-like [Brevipalpus obovatus]|uniref:cytochrome P450 4c21-like n=1 Tax=Brevipalpus obovatus TaxID=246614 RepID=UPI003D9E666E